MVAVPFVAIKDPLELFGVHDMEVMLEELNVNVPVSETSANPSPIPAPEASAPAIIIVGIGTLVTLVAVAALHDTPSIIAVKVPSPPGRFKSPSLLLESQETSVAERRTVRENSTNGLIAPLNI